MTWEPALGALKYAVLSLIFLAYWTYLESTTGQSIVKKLLKIKTAGLTGNNNLAVVRNVALESFGKSFLLPIDVLLDWIFSNDKRQRVLSRDSNTIVIGIRDVSAKEQIKYVDD